MGQTDIESIATIATQAAPEDKIIEAIFNQLDKLPLHAQMRISDAIYEKVVGNTKEHVANLRSKTDHVDEIFKAFLRTGKDKN